MLLYTPVVTDEDFAASIAYLSRRLDENAGPENFLRSLFTITPGSPVWDAERAPVRGRRRRPRGRSSRTPRRTQDRRSEQRRFDPDAPFANEPDTDFTQAANRAWIAEHLRDGPAGRAPAARHDDGRHRRRRRAGPRAALRGGGRRPRPNGAAALARVAEVMAADRGRTLAVMAHETGKTVREGDPEVSEAIDFASWAAASTRELDDLAADGVAADPLGVVLVAGPWNFPTAIPANGVVAALAAGNAVILKPAPEAVATAVELVRHVHEAGVPDDVVQLVRCPDDDVGRHLVTHPGVDGVVLTGSYDTARLFLGWRPTSRLLAETSGKNALVDQPDGRRRPRPARPRPLGVRPRRAEVLGGEPGDRRGAAVRRPGVPAPPRRRRAQPPRRPGDRARRRWSARSSAQPSGPLARALTQLDDGESWLVEPRPLDDERPAVVAGRAARRAPGSWFHQTECFGPVLGVMRADDLDHAIELQNAVDYGLTGGLHSLDEREIERWLDRVEVGNAYVNRHTTGAIVRRQPFGGWKRSSVGRGAKTGGPDDINRFVTFRPRRGADEARRRVVRAVVGASGSARDRPQGLRSEANVLRYRPVAGVIVRASGRTRRPRTWRRSARAAAVAGVPMDGVRTAGRAPRSSRTRRAGGRIASTGVERLRAAHPSTRRCAPHATTPVSPSTPRRSPTTGASSCRAGCASRRSPGRATATDGSPSSQARARGR